MKGEGNVTSKTFLLGQDIGEKGGTLRVSLDKNKLRLVRPKDVYGT